MSNNLKALLRLSVAACAAASLAACATVTRGTNDHFHVESTPTAATVTTSHGFTCTTPCTAGSIVTRTEVGALADVRFNLTFIDAQRVAVGADISLVGTTFPGCYDFIV